MSTTLADAVLTVMLALSPPERWTALPGHEEAPAARLERYGAIARDIAAEGRDEAGAGLLLAVAWHESGFAHDVDTGRCYRGPGWEGRCDSGRAVCLTQLQLPRREREAARTDRRTCLRLGLEGIRRSLATCRTSIPAHRFAGLSGSCSRGLAGSRRIHAIHVRASAQLGAALRSGSGS